MGLKRRLIASLLLRDGRLVKGRAFKDHRDAGNPITTVRSLCAQGIDEVMVLDIGETRPNFDWLEQIAAVCTAPLTWGGGIASDEMAVEMLGRGADKIFIPSHQTDLCSALCLKMGDQAVVTGIDFTERLEWPEKHGGELRVVSVESEGKRAGMDLDMIRAFALRYDVPIIAEGGAGTPEHVVAAFEAGASAVGLGAMLIFGDNNILKIKRYMKQRGIEVRL